MIYGIGTKTIEELSKHLKPLPDEPVPEADEADLFVPSSVYQVLTGGLMERSDSMSKSKNSSKTHNKDSYDTTSSSAESSVDRPIHKLSHYVLQTSINSLRVGDLWADSGCVRAVGGHKSHDALRKKMAALGIQPVIKSTHDNFQFGNGDVSEATQNIIVPCISTW